MSLTKEEVNNNKDISYIRILGFDTIGREYLNKIKKDISIPIITKYNDKYLNIEYRVSSIINLNRNEKQEYEYKPIIKD